MATLNSNAIVLFYLCMDTYSTGLQGQQMRARAKTGTTFWLAKLDYCVY